MSSSARLPLLGRPSIERRRVGIPLITELVESAGLSDREAERVAVAVVRTTLGYLPEPLQVRVRGELSARLYRRVGSGAFPGGNRFADPNLFFERVALETGSRPARAKALSQTVMGAWSRAVTPSLLMAIAGYMPTLFKVLVPARSELVWVKPRSPLEPGAPPPLCTAPAGGYRWHKIGGSFGRLTRHYSGPALEEVQADQGPSQG